MTGPDSGGGTGPRSARARRSRGGRGGGRWAVALVLGLAVFVATLAGTLTQLLPRTFSPAQRRAIVAWEMARRWRTWPAGKVFPASIGYRLPGSLLGGGAGIDLVAHRVGIAHPASCKSALDAGVAVSLARDGCVTVLRSTYGDATGTLAVTVGVVVLAGPGPASTAAKALPTAGLASPGLRAVPFQRTVTSRFGDVQRQLAWHAVAGPYLIVATVGYTDGRHRVVQSSDTYAQGEMFALAGGVGKALVHTLGAPPPPPACPGGPGC